MMKVKRVPFSHDPKNPEGYSLRDILVMIAKDFLEQGVPWRHQGRDRRGVDCAGLLFAVVIEATGVEIDVQNYSRQPDERTIRKLMKQFLIPLYDQEPEPGDIFLLREGHAVCHMGFFTGDTFIHADVGEKKIVEQGVDEYLQAKVRGVFRVPIYKKKKNEDEQ